MHAAQEENFYSLKRRNALPLELPPPKKIHKNIDKPANFKSSKLIHPNELFSAKNFCNILEKGLPPPLLGRDASCCSICPIQ